MLLLLWHGQASLEMAFFNFSMNRNIEEKNLKAESLIAQRHIYEFIHLAGGLFNVNVDKPILKVASSA